MSIKLMAFVKSFGNAGFIAWIDNIKGLVVQGNSVEDVYNELLISLKVKLAYDWGVNIDEIETNHLSDEDGKKVAELKHKDIEILQLNGQKELNLMLI